MFALSAAVSGLYQLMKLIFIAVYIFAKNYIFLIFIFAVLFDCILLKGNRMTTSYATYLAVGFMLPSCLALITRIGMAVAGFCILTPGKVVRIIFPYIKRDGENTVVFGFILSKDILRKIFWFMVLTIAYDTTNIFWTSFFVKVSHRYNPLEYDCYILDNESATINHCWYNYY